MKKGQYNIISLFSGALGLDLGLDATGRFRLRACIEKVPAFAATIRLNRDKGRLPSDLQVFEGNITDLDPLQVIDQAGMRLEDVDLIVGGPPCQSFSTAGRRQSIQDPRGTLLWQFLRFVEVLKPKFFLMENVRGLLSAALQHRPISLRPDKGGAPLLLEEEPGSVIRLFATDLQGLSSARYHLDIFEVNSANYGTPQIRERALFIGNRFGSVVDFPNPTHGVPGRNPEPQGSHFETTGHLQPWHTLRDAIGDLAEESPAVMDFSPRKKRFLSHVPAGSNWRSLPLEMQKESMGAAFTAKGGRSGWWRRLTYDLPCPTLVTMPNHASTSLCHPKLTRALSIREYARIQEFPDSWEFCGKLSEQYAQVGNAVPIRLGMVAGQVIAQELDKLSERGWNPYPPPSDEFRIVYIQSHIRTRQWFKNSEVKTWGESEDSQDAVYGPPRTKRRVRRIHLSTK